MNGSKANDDVLSPTLRWQELCAHIRTTDEISFKLLGLVPAISVAGIAVALMKREPTYSPMVVLLSLFGAVVTTAIWIWERRNIQTCLWLIARAAEMEEQLVGISRPGHFYGLPEAPGGKGKREAEKRVYEATIAAWLLLPAAIFITDLRCYEAWHTWVSFGGYATAAGWIGCYAWSALRVPIDVPDW